MSRCVAPPRSGLVSRWIPVALCLAIVMSGCAIGVDQSAREISPPPDLFATTPTTTPGAVKEDFGLVLFFVNEADQLVRLTRRRDAPLTSFQDALDALATPSEDEVAENPGLTSKLPPVTWTPVELDDEGTLMVNVTGNELRDLSEKDPPRVKLVYAQIVCTIAALGAAIKAVQVRDDKDVIQVLVGDAPETRPVGPADFDNCQTAPPVSNGSSTTTSRTTR
jgi:hypothetical protein